MASTPLKALVVGGEPSFVDSKFGPHLERAGIEPVGHWSWDLARAPGSLPQCELIVVIKDMVGHKLRNAAVFLAKKNGLRIAEVPRKWAKAEKHLFDLGLAKRSCNDDHEPVHLQVPLLEVHVSVHRLHEADHLCLRSIRGLITGHQIAEPVELDAGTYPTDRIENSAKHQQKLAHRQDIEHLRMHRDQD